jgi:FtsP/CotA-like multicopper oxidase with cupredoxin domain
MSITEYRDHPELDAEDPEGVPDYPPMDPIVRTGARDARAWREWLAVGVGLTALLAVLAFVVGVVALVTRGDGEATTVVRQAAPAAAAADASAPTLADAKGVAFEKYEYVDPTLPPVPAGAVKRFTVDVLQHPVQVDPALAPTEAWTYTVNGKAYRGVAASPPIVVNEGDRVEIRFVNGGSKAMHVNMPHSIDFHSAEVAPSKYYVDVAPGQSEVIRFTAGHPGVFMYHCATQPILMHTSAGMMGMMVVKPKGLPPVDKELWMTQEEYYLGQPGGPADMAKMTAERPDVLAFNGYANQYKVKPIVVRRGERIRMYVLDAGPSRWSAFHVIGTVFDRTVVEGVVGHDSQTMSLAPSQGGYAEFTLDQEGSYPFVTHAFGDMVKGAAGILRTEHAPQAAAEGAQPAAGGQPAANGGQPAAKADVNLTMGEMWIKADHPTVKAGRVTFGVRNAGATMHGFAIAAAPVKAPGGMVDERSFLAAGEHLDPGQSEAVSVTLKPGRYELICHMAGHYAAGQKMPFTVTS